jgi:lipopolysaccharide biosynthesis glycosyltransferase
LPRLLHDRYARILYLDADVSIESDRVFQLFDLDLHGHAVAAVRDMTVPFVAHSINANELNATLGLKGDERFVGLFGAKYLNSGVLLIDVDTYRQRKIESDAMRLVETSMRSPALVDQSLFNAVLRGKWLEMSPSFNMITRAWASFIRDFAPPAIVHFTGQTKPWHHAFADEHPLRSQLRAFLKTSPWSDFILRENPITLGPNSRPPAEPQAPSWGPKGMEALLNYLRTTAFADVEQGLTTLNYAALPA